MNIEFDSPIRSSSQSLQDRIRMLEESIRIDQEQLRQLKVRADQLEYMDMFERVNNNLPLWHSLKDKVKASYSIVTYFAQKGYNRKNIIKRIAKDMKIDVSLYGKLLRNP